MNQYPGTNFHDLNLNWLLNEMKNCLTEWASTKEDWEDLETDNAAFKERIESEWDSFEDYVRNYLTNLDVSQEINAKIDAMIESGQFRSIIINDVVGQTALTTASWLNSHITQETGYVIDDTLTVSGAAADAKAAGDRITELNKHLGSYLYSITNYSNWHNVVVTGNYSTDDSVYIKTFAYENCTVNIVLGFSGGTTSTIYANETTGKEYYLTLPADVVSITVAYKTSSVVSGTYNAVVINTADENAFGYIAALKKGVADNKASIADVVTANNTPFVDAVPPSIQGIIAFKINKSPDATPLSSVKDYRVNTVYYKSSGFYLYIALQRLVGSTWGTIGSVLILTADAPATEDPLMFFTSSNGAFTVAVLTDKMSATALSSKDYRLKPPSTQPFLTDMQSQVNAINNELGRGDFELKDTISHIVTVDANGNGDYTTIASAYAAVLSAVGQTYDAYLEQYEIVVYPGTYNEKALVPPPFTHTHGLFPGTVTVTSEGLTGTDPVFDQKYYPSKLSNMKIISGTGYCVHQDSALNTVLLVNENLHLKKVYDSDVSNYGWASKTNPSVVGDGAQFYGAKFVWRNCIFEDGIVAFHSNSSSNPNANQHVVFENCVLVNAIFQLMMAGNEGANRNGYCVAEFNGCYAPQTSVALSCKFGARVNDADNFVWNIIGGNNHNFAIKWDNYSDPSATDAWGNINTNEVAKIQATSALTKGQWITNSLSVCSAEEKAHNVMGVVLADASSGDTVSVWVGNAFAFTGTNGEYGIGSDGALSSSATEKIGRVINNVFFRY